jgi:pyrroloquinoline quinone biosynthesis protein E
MTSVLSLTDRPAPRRGVRTGTDPLSNQTVLLFPEGVLLLNETAAAVIRHCDGRRSVADIVQALTEVYDNVAVTDIIALLQDLVAQNLLVSSRG